MFDDAFDEIIKLMSRDSFQRFKRGELCQDFLQVYYKPSQNEMALAEEAILAKTVSPTATIARLVIAHVGSESVSSGSTSTTPVWHIYLLFQPTNKVHVSICFYSREIELCETPVLAYS